MKKHFLFLAAALIAATTLFAQSANNEDEVIKIDEMNRNAYREGEILVKFKADGAVQMRAPRKMKFATSKVNSVDALFSELGVDSVEQLMPMTGHKNVGRKMRAYNGSEVEVKDLRKLYRLTLKPEKAQSLHEAIDRLQAMEEVEFAEPNYIVYTMALPYNDSIPTADSATYVNEPLYSQQWGLSAINLPQLWNKPKRTNKRPVIAILDTGVDIEHPDLAANIWTNTTEANGIANQDDDANGFKDDIHGWDFINNHSVTGDFNGHGTHCAGIAAAVGNNGIGITGANPDALIMPVTVLQSNGTGDVATIVKGIDYAAANGADVISMSIGGYSYSMAEEQALGRAYANAVLVASAGNDHISISELQPCIDHGAARCFPASFTFVLGVEASSNAIGSLASFSNYDPDGPIYSEFSDEQQYNYELRAPGVQIMSTFPGGRYKHLNGTSMACPLVAGAISRLLQTKEFLSKELLFGDLIHTRVVGGLGNVDFIAAYNITDANRHPELSLVTYSIVDSVNGDGDGRADAGETLEIYPILKNAWGQAENIRFWIKTGFYNQGDWVWDDTTLVQHLQDTAYLGKPLSSYAKATSINPWRMTINPDCADNRNINLTFFAICDNTIDTLIFRITLRVENGVEIHGRITEDMVLSPNVHYIVTGDVAILDGVTLTIKPGTTIIFNRYHYHMTTSGSENQANIIAIGKPDSLICFKSGAETHNTSVGDFTISFNSKKISEDNYSNTLEYIEVENGQIMKSTAVRNAKWKQNNHCTSPYPYNKDVPWYKIAAYDGAGVGDMYSTRIGYPAVAGGDTICKFNNWLCDIASKVDYKTHPYPFNNGSLWSVATPRDYYGTSSIQTLQKMVNPDYLDCFDFSYTSLKPFAEAHGIVWKILIDGIDAQDEFDLLPPIGVGQHRCDVYFNRAMDTSATPFVAFGVRPPYTQHQIAENGSWSADSTIYTAYFTIDGRTVSDGLNRLYVADAQDDEHFEITTENFRFNMEVAAAGSMSTGLMAEAGLGKVTLTWETDEEDFDDLLGYNIYRWTTDTIKQGNTWRFDTICINSTLIDASDSAYNDYNVVPGKDYYYVIRQMTTSLENYDLSNPVVARPLTAIKGDANGSMSVDVADVITEVNYITRQNPQPFIFEAADVNSDDQVNIIDVVATIDLILHPQAQGNAISEDIAYYYIDNGILYVESDLVLAGVQCTFEAEQDHPFTALAALDEFEKVGMWQSEDNYLFLAYSMSGKTLGIGKNALLQIGDAELTNIIVSDAQGHNVPVAPRISQALDGTTFIPAASKYIKDGSLFIKHGEHIYNATGIQIK